MTQLQLWPSAVTRSMGSARKRERAEMRYIAICVAVLSLAGGSALALPPIAVQTSIDSVSVMVMDKSWLGSPNAPSYVITRWPDGAVLASGSIPVDRITRNRAGIPSFTITGLHPKPWSPQDPQLYVIAISDASGNEIAKTRFGFRTFETKDGKFYLNGRPIFLRGLPINPPGRDIDPAVERDPGFIRGYLKLVKSAGVNTVRVDPPEWLDACDELGLMVFTGRYGPAPGGNGAIAPSYEQAQPFYRDMVLNLCSHPSVMIYVLTNEVDYKSKESTYKQFLSRIHSDLRALDPTRPVIGNAGFGRGEPGEIYDVHHYYGWYAGSAVDWYASFRSFVDAADKANKPLTLTECVGAYTCDSGEFETMSKQMATMLQWVGTAHDVRAASLEYQAELTRQIVELARRQHPPGDASGSILTRSMSGRGVAGIMPFSYYLGWARAKKAEDIIVKPAFEALKVAFQPVLISAECWHRNIYAGDTLKLRLCVANDDDSGRDLAPSRAAVEVAAPDGEVIASGGADFPAIPYYCNAWADISIPIPARTGRGYYKVNCRLFEDGKEISGNSFWVTIAPREWAACRVSHVTLFDPAGTTAAALKQLGAKFRHVPNLRRLPDKGVLVIGEAGLRDGGYPDRLALARFLEAGGRVLCLRQERDGWNADWLPARLVMAQNRHPFTYIQPMGRTPSSPALQGGEKASDESSRLPAMTYSAPYQGGDKGGSAIFGELTDRDLRFFNELGCVSGVIPDVYPVLTPLKPTTVTDLKSARVWAACDQLLSGWALVELYQGKGSILLSQFRLVERVKDDPVAAKLLSNLISYCASGNSSGLLDLTRPIRWDQEAFRVGVLQSPKQGFLPHSPTYKHEGTSKGRLGDDHRIDGVTLVGEYTITANGWLRPVPDPTIEGWGVFFGQLSRPVSRFIVKLRNPGDSAANIAVRLDGEPIGPAASIAAGDSRSIEWSCPRKPGPVQVELRGDQRLVITETCFQ